MDAFSYLKKAGSLLAPRRGVFTITNRGKNLLAQNPPKIDLKLLGQFPEFLAFKAKSKTLSEADHVQSTAPAAIETPLESLEGAYEKIRAELKSDLLDRLKGEAPAVFERIVIICTALPYAQHLVAAQPLATLNPDLFHFRVGNFLTSSVIIVSPVSGNRLRAHSSTNFSEV